LPVLKRLHEDGIAFTMDILGEETLSASEAASYQRRYIALIDGLADAAPKWAQDDVVDKNHMGAIPRVNVSVKITALDSQLEAADPKGGVARLKEIIVPILLRARERGVFVNFDMESWGVHGITYDLFEEVLGHPELKSWPDIGIVAQAYLKDSEKDVGRLISLAKKRGAPITVRLVKGAYWDYEVASARLNGHDCPVFTEKSATDANYERLSGLLLDNADHIHTAFASHNMRSLANAMVAAKDRGLPGNSCEIQMLYGMAEPERKAIRAMGRRVRLYVPMGEFLPGIGYLVRRLLENTSNTSFVRLSYHEKVNEDELLAKPEVKGDSIFENEMVKGDIRTPFENCPLTDFTHPDERERFKKAVERMRQSLPLKAPFVIDGVEHYGGSALKRYYPGDRSVLVSEVAQAKSEDAQKAVKAASDAWPEWRDRPLEERAKLLENLGNKLEDDRLWLAALQIFECGKPWREADGDVAEAVDFCRYYARRALVELGTEKEGDLPGEENFLFYEGRGPAVIVAPWNFPLAILCGMATAALVAGNTVIIKPSGLSGMVAYEFYKKIIEAGFPKSAVHFLPGRGADIGDLLVTHPMVAQVAFTGSKEVGLSIIEKSAKTRKNQPQVKRVVCEMGGKNAIIIDEDADLDQAVSGIVKSAFGYAGQKCSACSRVIVLEGVYETFVSRITEACKSLVIAAPHDPACRVGPVINEEAQKRLLAIIENPGEGATPIYIGKAPEGGNFVPPALFAVESPTHQLMRKELFGPVVAVIKAKTFDEALETATSIEFALTGGVYSRSPVNIRKAGKKFRVGNLYINRWITGALVGRQPFGGFAMSGTGTKAGGPGYLSHFADPRCVTENTMQRGFTPEMVMTTSKMKKGEKGK
ncbi:MAG: bifunctional proline dehydrogenase/L-glutamate gamma-semialdehyde dehydrogenase, partial [Nitrospinota bacterium]